LAALTVAKLRDPGHYGDGGGLWLQVSPTGTKSWVFRYRAHGRVREMGLGSLIALPLADARQAAAECRKQRAAGIDPIEARKAERARARLAEARALTFKACAEACIAAHAAGWRNAKHAKQWGATLAAYAFPAFGDLPVADVDTGLVVKALEAIWREKPETASRVRQRIERVLDWATVRGFRQGANPARWKGHLDTLLPARAKLRPVEHHAALPWAEVPAFVADLRSREALAARAVEFAILTAARTGEVLGARWAEFDLQAGTWTVPAERMKAGREHRVPLSREALAILSLLKGTSDGEYVFPGGRRGRPLSGMALLMLLRRMGRGDLTAHGFRSSFRDWAAERTNYPRAVAEAALAHRLKDKTEAAYARSDLFERRRRLMADWARFCHGGAAKAGGVVAIGGRAATE
jgi:integrase